MVLNMEQGTEVIKKGMKGFGRTAEPSRIHVLNYEHFENCASRYNVRLPHWAFTAIKQRTHYSNPSPK